jgi:hypothetical protein
MNRRSLIIYDDLALRRRIDAPDQPASFFVLDGPLSDERILERRPMSDLFEPRRQPSGSLERFAQRA